MSISCVLDSKEIVFYINKTLYEYMQASYKHIVIYIPEYIDIFAVPRLYYRKNVEKGYMSIWRTNEKFRG